MPERRRSNVGGPNAEVLQTLRRTMQGFQLATPASSALFAQVSSFEGAFRGLDLAAVSRLASNNVANEINRALTPPAASDFTKALGAYSVLQAARGGFAHSAVLDLARVSERMSRLIQVQQLGTSFTEAFRPIRDLSDATQRWIASQQEIDEKTDAFVRKHAWPVPLSIPLRAYRRIVGMADDGKREVTAFMKAAFSPDRRAYREAVQRLLASPHFETRRPLLQQAVRAHRRGEWYLAINALLPSVEGVLLDATFPEGAQRGVGARQGVERLKNAAAADSTVEAIETILLSAGANSALFESFDRSRYGRQGEPRSLNRHAILHGAARRYGTAENALRLLLLLVVMAEVLDLYERDLPRAV